MKIPEGLKNSISSKVLGKAARAVSSKVSPEGGSSDKTGQLFKVIAKNFISLPGLARDLNVARQNIQKLVKLEGGKPSKKADAQFLKEEETSKKLDVEMGKGKEIEKKPTVVKKDDKKGGIMSILGSMLKVGAIIFALSQVPGGFIKDIFDGIIDSIKELATELFEQISTAFNGFVADVKKFFNDVVQPIIDELKIFLQGVWQKITDFFKPIFDWVGEKIKIIVEYLQPVFDFIKKIFDKMMALIAPLKPYYDSLVSKINEFKKYIPQSILDKVGLGDKKPEVPPSSTPAASLPSTKSRDGSPAAPSGPAPVVSAGTPPTIGSLDDTKKMIIKHEGIRDKPYKDSLGLWTVGVGHLIGDGKTLPEEYNRTFTNAEIMKMFDDDFEHHAKAAEKIPGYNKSNQPAQGALIDLTFNMGTSWYKKWPTFVKKLSEGDFQGAAEELASSKWATQVKSRAQTIIGLITGGGEGSSSPVSTDKETKTASAPPSPTPAPTSASIPSVAPKPLTASIEESKSPTGGLAQYVNLQSGVDFSGLNSEFEKRLAAMAAAFKEKTGKKLLITSGIRSNEKQKELYDKKVAELGGNEEAARKLVAEPMPPLGKGKGSSHLTGFALDINSKGSDGLNVLSGTKDNSTGWLEKFGLVRNVPGEDWHVQSAGSTPTPDNPLNPGAPILVADKSGKPVEVNTGKKDTIGPALNPPSTGSQIASSSTSVAADQRYQQKPQTPVIVNAPTTNTSTIVKNESGGSRNVIEEDPNYLLLERLT